MMVVVTMMISCACTCVLYTSDVLLFTHVCLMEQVLCMHVTSNAPYVILMNQAGETALIWAAQNGHAAVVTLLLNRGASVDVANKVE